MTVIYEFQKYKISKIQYLKNNTLKTYIIFKTLCYDCQIQLLLYTKCVYCEMVYKNEIIKIF